MAKNADAFSPLLLPPPPTTNIITKIFTHSCCYNIVLQMECEGPHYKWSVENTQKGHQQLYKNIY